MTFALNDVITNGSSAGKVIEIVKRDPTWKCAGVRVMNIGLETFGGNVGFASFVPDYLSWKLVSFEWAPVIGGGLEERYVWTAGGKRLAREVRRIEP